MAYSWTHHASVSFYPWHRWKTQHKPANLSTAVITVHEIGVLIPRTLCERTVEHCDTARERRPHVHTRTQQHNTARKLNQRLKRNIYEELNQKL